jgi:CBS domain-containing protein
LIELLEKLREYPPFSFLDDLALAKIDANSVVAYYTSDTVLVDISQAFDNIFVIIKGSVASYNSDDEMVDIYHEHDTFGGIEHLKSLPLECRFVVHEELIC